MFISSIIVILNTEYKLSNVYIHNFGTGNSKQQYVESESLSVNLSNGFTKERERERVTLY